MNVITFTKVSLPYGWLGNMSPYPIEFNGKTYKTSEALFQSLRFNDESIQEIIRSEKSPMTAKMRMKENKEHMIITPHSKQDVLNMELCLNLKLNQHPQLVKELIETSDATIIEDVTARGDVGGNLFWGAMLVNGEWIGENTLGKLWMKIRNKHGIK